MQPLLPAWQMIDRSELLPSLITRLEDAPRAAIDTESNSLFVYRERICLLQISIPEMDFLVDPLGIPDLSPLARFLENPQKEKVFHASEYDLLCLRRDFGFHVRGIFDTYAAVRSLGVRECGLGNILEKEFEIQLDKRFQRADWGKRPLTDAQQQYARMDTRFLLPLRDRLAERLAIAGLEMEAQEEFRRLELLPDAENDTPSASSFWRIRGVYDLSPHKRAVLFALYQWRDREAEHADRPPFYILGEKELVRLAERMPMNDEELGLCELPRSILMRRGDALLRIVSQSQNNPPPPPPPSRRLDDATADRLKALQQWRKKKAEARQVESDVILSKDIMNRIARLAPRTPEALAAIHGFGAWKQSNYTSEILALINKEPS
jgi:ribonuclease D